MSVDRGRGPREGAQRERHFPAVSLLFFNDSRKRDKRVRFLKNPISPFTNALHVPCFHLKDK